MTSETDTISPEIEYLVHALATLRANISTDLKLILHAIVEIDVTLQALTEAIS